MAVSLFSCRKIESEDLANPATFHYDLNSTCAQVLNVLIENLELENPNDYSILVYFPPQSNKGVILEPNDTLGDCVTSGGLIIPGIEAAHIKVKTDLYGETELDVDLTISVYEIMEQIADELKIYCQTEQYSLWYMDAEMNKIPLDSTRSIVVQTSQFSKLFFKRRFYLIVQKDLEDTDICMHIFRDAVYTYTKSKEIQIKEEEVISLARMIIYGQEETPEKAKNIDLTDKLKNYVPHAFAKTKSLVKKIHRLMQKEGPLEKISAMVEFINTVRALKGFGEESFHAKLNDSMNKDRHISLYLMARGFRITEKDKIDKTLYNIPIKNIISVSISEKTIIVKFSDQKTKSNISSFTFRGRKHVLAYTYIEGARQLFNEFAGSAIKNKKKQNKDKMVQIDTVPEATKVIKELLKDYKDKTSYDSLAERLCISTEKDQLEKDEFQNFNEMNQVCNLIKDEKKFLQRIRTYSPKSNNDVFIIQATKKLFEKISESLENQIKDIYRINTKEALFTIECTVLVINAIADRFSYKNIKTNMQGILAKVQASFIKIKNNETMKLGMSDIREQIEADFISIADEIPDIINLMNSFRKELNEDQPISQEDFALLPRGSILLTAFSESINKLVIYLYEVSNRLNKHNVNIKTIFPVLAKLSKTVFEFWKELDAETCDTNAHVHKIIKIYKEIDPYLRLIYNTEAIPEKLHKKVTERFRSVLNFTWITLVCFAPKGSTTSIKFFPGTIAYRHIAFDALQDLETYLNQIKAMPIFEPDKQIIKFITDANNTIDKAITVSLKLLSELESSPTNEMVRTTVVQSMSITKRAIVKVRDRVFQYQQNIPPTIYQTIQMYIEQIDDFLYSLTPLNISTQRVDSCNESLDALITSMREAQLNEEWIEKIASSREKFNEWLPKFTENPTDGPTLFAIHREMHQVVRTIKTLEGYMYATDNATIPILIEVLLMSIIKTLANQEYQSSTEPCTHVAYFSQLHINIAIVITFFSNVLVIPQVSVEESLVEETKDLIKKLNHDHMRLSHIRPNFMVSPFTFSELINVSKIINDIKIIVANLIPIAHNISAVTMSTTPLQFLIDLINSIQLFYQKTEELQIRPYMRLYSQVETDNYKKMLIDMIAFLRVKSMEMGIITDKNHFINKEVDELKTYLNSLQLIKNQQTYEFNEYCTKMVLFLDSMHTKTSKISGFWDEKNEKLYQHFYEVTDRIATGEKPSAEILKQLIKNVIETIAQYPAKIVQIVKVANDPNIKKFISVINGISKQLTNELKTSDFKPKAVEKIQHILTFYYNNIPQLVPMIKENPATRKIISSLDDLINLTRQMPMPNSIDYVGEKLKAVDTDDISLYASTLKHQFNVMETVFEELKIHPLVEESPRITELIFKVAKFFTDNSNVLNIDVKKLERILGDFCRQIEPTLAEMIKLIKLLLPILTDMQLIDNVKVIQTTVNNIINVYDKNHLTYEMSDRFKHVTIPLLHKFTKCGQNAIKSEEINVNKEGGRVVQQIITTINNDNDSFEGMKPPEVREWCNNFFPALRNVKQAEKELNPTGIMNNFYPIFRQTNDYVADEMKLNISETESLVNNFTIVSEGKINSLFKASVNAISNPESFTQQNETEFNNLIEMINNNPQDIPANIATLNFACNQNREELVKNPIMRFTSYSRIVSLIGTNSNTKVEQMQELAIQCTVKAASIIEQMREKIKAIPIKTVFHKQFAEIIKQTDTDIIMKLKNMSSIAFTYSPMRMIIQLGNLSLIEDKEFNILMEKYTNAVLAADAALSAALTENLAAIINFIESQGVFPEFINKVTNTMKSNAFHLTSFDIDFTASILSEYLIFEANNQETIENNAEVKKGAWKKLQKMMELVSPFKAIITQWSQPATARHQTSLKSFLQGTTLIITRLTKNIKLGNSIIPYSQIRSFVKQIISNIHFASDLNIDVKEYLKGLKELEEAITECDKSAFAFINGAKQRERELISRIQNIFSAANVLRAACGEIEVHVEEEEEKPEEEEKVIEYVNVNEELPKIINNVIIQDYKTLQTDVDEVIKSIKHTNSPELLPFIQPLEMLLTSREGRHDFLLFVGQLEYNKHEKEFETVTDTNTINSIFLDNISEFHEIQARLNNKTYTCLEDELRKLAETCSNANLLLISAFETFNYITQETFEFYLQTSEQLWDSIIKIIKLYANKTNDDIKIRNSLRSAERLISGLSYIVEDTLLQVKPEQNTPLIEGKVMFCLACSKIIKKATHIIKACSMSKFIEQYQLYLTKVSRDYDAPFPGLLPATERLMAVNLKEDVSNKYNDEVAISFTSYTDFKGGFVNMNGSLPDYFKCLIEGKKIYDVITNLCATVGEMTDIIEKDPDPEMAEKASVRFSVPAIPEIKKGCTMEEVNASFDPLLNDLDRSIAAFEKIIYGSTGEDKIKNKAQHPEISAIPNEKIVESAMNLRNTITEVLKTTLLASVVTPYIDQQNDLTGIAAEISTYVNDMSKGLRHKLMAETDWESEIDDPLTHIKECRDRIKNIGKESVERNKQKRAEEDILRYKIEEIAKPLITLKTQLSTKLAEVSELPAAPQKECTLTLIDIAITTCTTLTSLILFLSNNQDYMCTDVTLLEAYIERGVTGFKGLIDVIPFISTKVESEDHLSASTSVIISIIDSTIPLYKSDEALAYKFTETLNDIKGGAVALSDAALNMKKVRLEKEEAERRREAEREARRRAMEERQRAAKQRPQGKVTRVQKTKESLLELLMAEAAVIRARIQLREQKKVINALETM